MSWPPAEPAPSTLWRSDPRSRSGRHPALGHGPGTGRASRHRPTGTRSGHRRGDREGDHQRRSLDRQPHRTRPGAGRRATRRRRRRRRAPPQRHPQRATRRPHHQRLPAPGDVHDAVVSRHGGGLADLAPGSTIGTSSVRRAAQITGHWPEVWSSPSEATPPSSPSPASNASAKPTASPHSYPSRRCSPRSAQETSPSPPAPQAPNTMT